MKQRYYWIIGILAYVFFVLFNTPAAQVINLIDKQFKLPAKFYGVQGTIWSGSSDALVINRTRLDNVRWSINPFSLLALRISTDVEADIKQSRTIGTLVLYPDGSMHGKSVRARINARDLQQMIALPFGQLEGEININLETLELLAGGLPKATGQVKWRNAKLTLTEAVDLGQIDINLEPEQKNLKATISNKGGMIAINGTAIISDNKAYTLDIEFKPEASASASITQSLGMFARRLPNGVYQLKQNGNLARLGF
ncbi:MAG: type II secretion system protein N [Gammaproteobacteria bacterium]|nr:MAG: type II secretion system protein N [Gammaproteobacteria bacterium]